MDDIKALARTACKIEKKYEAAAKKIIVKKRLLKQAMSVEKRLLAAMRKVMPLSTKPEEILDSCQRLLANIHHQMLNRIGHTPKNPVPRKDRRKSARDAAKLNAKRLP